MSRIRKITTSTRKRVARKPSRPGVTSAMLKPDFSSPSSVPPGFTSWGRLYTKFTEFSLSWKQAA
jgi:hypothetical protein